MKISLLVKVRYENLHITLFHISFILLPYSASVTCGSDTLTGIVLYNSYYGRLD